MNERATNTSVIERNKVYQARYYRSHRGRLVEPGGVLRLRKERDDELLAFIKDYRKRGYSPTLSEIAGFLKVGKSTVKARMDRLARDKRVTWTPGLSRTVRVTGR